MLRRARLVLSHRVRRGATKSRPAYAELIAANGKAAEEQAEAKVASDPAPALRQDIDLVTRRLDQAIERELCLLHEVDTLREENRQLRMGRPFPGPDSRKPHGGRTVRAVFDPGWR